VMLMQVASTAWGTSGLMGTFAMTAGPRGAMWSLLCYLIGVLISYIMGCIITWFGVKDDVVAAG